MNEELKPCPRCRSQVHVIRQCGRCKAHDATPQELGIALEIAAGAILDLVVLDKESKIMVQYSEHSQDSEI